MSTLKDQFELYAPAAFWAASSEVRSAVCNGCGPGGIGDRLVPDTVWGLSVRPACRIHDWMYYHGKTIHDKDEADRVFLNNMVRIIHRRGGLLKMPRLLRASTMYYAVHLFGGPFFWAGKND